MDAIQHLLTYLATGPKYETEGKTKIEYEEDPATGEQTPVFKEYTTTVYEEDPETGEKAPVPRKTPRPWDFTKDFDTWQKALNAIYSNLRTTAMSRSFEKTRRKKTEKSVEELSKQSEEGRTEPWDVKVKTPPETGLGKALDDKLAVKEFINLIDEHIDDLKDYLSEDTRKLFDVIFEDEVGSFGSDVKENMNQASILKEKYPELYEKVRLKAKDPDNPKTVRWSPFVADLRKQLLEEIWNYIEDEMSYNDYARLRDQFFVDISPTEVRKLEKEKEKEKELYQRGLDERKLARLKAELEEKGKLDSKKQNEYDRIESRLKSQGVNTDKIEADPYAGAAGKKKKRQEEKAKAAATKITKNPIQCFWLA
jgi:hypothetical protein